MADKEPKATEAQDKPKAKAPGAPEKYIVQHTAVSLQADVDGEVQERLLAKGDVVDAALLGKGLDRLVKIGAIAPYYGATEVGETDMAARAGVARPEAFGAMPSGVVNSAGRDDATGQALVLNKEGVPTRVSAKEASDVETQNFADQVNALPKGAQPKSGAKLEGDK